MSKPNTISGNTPIDKILAATELAVSQEPFVLVGLPPAAQVHLEKTLAHIPGRVMQYIREPDALTLLLPQSTWQEISAAYPSARVEGPLRLFTFTVAMDWNVVGFLAAVTGLLAQAGVPLGAVCGYYRDHLFIAQDFAERAETVLREKIATCRAEQQ